MPANKRTIAAMGRSYKNLNNRHMARSITRSTAPLDSTANLSFNS
jgi:hypothetical protein